MLQNPQSESIGKSIYDFGKSEYGEDGDDDNSYEEVYLQSNVGQKSLNNHFSSLSLFEIWAMEQFAKVPCTEMKSSWNAKRNYWKRADDFCDMLMAIYRIKLGGSNISISYTIS